MGGGVQDVLDVLRDGVQRRHHRGCRLRHQAEVPHHCGGGRCCVCVASRLSGRGCGSDCGTGGSSRAIVSSENLYDVLRNDTQRAPLSGVAGCHVGDRTKVLAGDAPCGQVASYHLDVREVFSNNLDVRVLDVQGADIDGIGGEHCVPDVRDAIAFRVPGPSVVR